jgi:D-alanine-D-alanine ligase
MKKTKLLVIFGGQSGEHGISVISANAVINALDPEKYNVQTLGITVGGRWCFGVTPADWLVQDNESGTDNPEVGVSLNPERPGFVPLTGQCGLSIYRPDVIFPLLHGPKGEDGSVQGVLEVMGIPYVGAGVLGSALGLDKDRMKAVFREAGLNVGPYLVYTAAQAAQSLTAIEEQLGLPVFVKPANLGSSVGLSKAHTREELAAAIALAATYDNKLVIEQNISGREIELAVLGNDEPEVTGPGEILPEGEFYDYAAKYERDSQVQIPADLPEDVVRTLQSDAITAFKAVGSRGLSRVDFFVSDSGKVYVNEINTMPGFTSISMYPKLWEAKGLSFTDLLDRLIELAQQ